MALSSLVSRTCSRMETGAVVRCVALLLMAVCAHQLISGAENEKSPPKGVPTVIDLSVPSQITIPPDIPWTMKYRTKVVQGHVGHLRVFPIGAYCESFFHGWNYFLIVFGDRNGVIDAPLKLDDDYCRVSLPVEERGLKDGFECCRKRISELAAIHGESILRREAKQQREPFGVRPYVVTWDHWTEFIEGIEWKASAPGHADRLEGGTKRDERDTAPRR